MKVLSYKDDGNEELLEEHIKKGLELIDKAKESKGIKFGERIFKKYKRKSLNRNYNFIECLKLAWIFHDLGKVFYQKSDAKRLIFVGHEILSTFFFKKFLSLIYQYDMDFALFSVLYHHHAMNLKNREIKMYIDEESYKYAYEEIFKGNYFERISDILRNNNSLNKYSQAFNDTINEVGKFLEEYDMSIFVSNVKNHVRHISEELWKRYISGTEYAFKKLCLLTTSILNCLDYKVSEENREVKKTVFCEASKEFIKYYL